MGKKDIRFLLMCIKYAKDKEAFSRLRELTGTAVVSEDTCGTIAEYLGEPELLKKGTGAEGGRDMCEAIRALVEDGRNEGLKQGLKQGLEQGIELTKQVFRLAGEQIAVENIAKALSISKGDGADNSSKQTTESPVTLDVVYNSSMSWSTADLGVILVEGATSNSDSTGAAGTGTRALTWNLTITPTLAADQPQPTAGTYVGCLWLVVDSGGTGA